MAIIDFMTACRDGRGLDALKLSEQESLTAAVVSYGIIELVAQQHFDAATSLIKKSDALDSETGKPTDKFIEEVLRASYADTTGAVLFLNSLGATYKAINMLSAWSDEDSIKQMITSGHFDINNEGALALQYAAASGLKIVFEELMKAGASPRKAITEGSDDLRWSSTYERIAQWAEEIVSKIPALAEKEQTPVTLKSQAHMKEARLSPCG